MGIKEIYVVVGFMKEKYEYLIDEYGVELVVNADYLYDDQTMKIEFNCEDVIRRALEKYGA